MDKSTISSLTRELKIHARALGIPDGAAEDFINHALSSAEKTIAKKSIITSTDLTRIVAKELGKYHCDLAYVFENRDTII